MKHLNMNFGKSVKKLASEFSAVFSLYKSAGICKTNSSLKAFEELKLNEIRLPLSAPIYNLRLSNLYEPYKEELNSIRKNDVPLQKKIEEPGKIIKIKIKLPVGQLKNDLDLPSVIEKEIQEPRTNISKRANSHRNSIKEIEGMHIISIRKRKMRIHKRKKYMKKHKVELMKKKKEHSFKKEYNFQMQLKEIIKKCESYSPEIYLNDTLKTAHWQRPVTKVRGILAPQWVIKDYLSKRKEDEMLKKRLEECINSRK